MALIKCTECGHSVSESATMCPNCGCPIKNKSIKDTELFGEKQKRVQRYLNLHKNDLPQNGTDSLRRLLLDANDRQWMSVEHISYKDPTTLVILSVAVGSLGIDRFILGKTASGILKLLLTLCCCAWPIWWWVSLIMNIGAHHRDFFSLMTGNLVLFFILWGTATVWWVYDLFVMHKMVLEYNCCLLKETVRRS